MSGPRRRPRESQVACGTERKAVPRMTGKIVWYSLATVIAASWAIAITAIIITILKLL